MNPLLAPRPGDPDRAEDILDEIRAILAKRGAALIVQDGRVFLGVQKIGSAGELRAIAEIQQITPFKITWRPFDWTKGVKPS